MPLSSSVERLSPFEGVQLPNFAERASLFRALEPESLREGHLCQEGGKKYDSPIKAHVYVVIPVSISPGQIAF